MNTLSTLIPNNNNSNNNNANNNNNNHNHYANHDNRVNIKITVLSVVI